MRILQRSVRIALGLLRRSRLVPNGIALACTRPSSRTPPMPSAADPLPSAADPLRLLGRHPARELLPSAALDEETIARRCGQAHIGSPSPRALSMREHESAKLGVDAGQHVPFRSCPIGPARHGSTSRGRQASMKTNHSAMDGFSVGSSMGSEYRRETHRCRRQRRDGIRQDALRGSPSASPQRARSRSIGGLGRRSK